jgi:hypothetical protein
MQGNESSNNYLNVRPRISAKDLVPFFFAGTMAPERIVIAFLPAICF